MSAKSIFKKILIGVGVFFGLMIVIGIFSGGSKESSTSDESVESAQQNEQTTSAEEASADAAAVEPVPEPKVVAVYSAPVVVDCFAPTGNMVTGTVYDTSNMTYTTQINIRPRLGEPWKKFAGDGIARPFTFLDDTREVAVITVDSVPEGLANRSEINLKTGKQRNFSNTTLLSENDCNIQ